MAQIPYQTPSNVQQGYSNIGQTLASGITKTAMDIEGYRSFLKSAGAVKKTYEAINTSFNLKLTPREGETPEMAVDRAAGFELLKRKYDEIRSTDKDAALPSFESWANVVTNYDRAQATASALEKKFKEASDKKAKVGAQTEAQTALQGLGSGEGEVDYLKQISPEAKALGAGKDEAYALRAQANQAAMADRNTTPRPPAAPKPVAVSDYANERVKFYEFEARTAKNANDLAINTTKAAIAKDLEKKFTDRGVQSLDHEGKNKFNSMVEEKFKETGTVAAKKQLAADSVEERVNGVLALAQYDDAAKLKLVELALGKSGLTVDEYFKLMNKPNPFDNMIPPEPKLGFIDKAKQALGVGQPEKPATPATGSKFKLKNVR